MPSRASIELIRALIELSRALLELSRALTELHRAFIVHLLHASKQDVREGKKVNIQHSLHVSKQEDFHVCACVVMCIYVRKCVA